MQNETDMKNLITKTTTSVLIETMISTLKDLTKAGLNIMIQEELENRIGENEVDLILDANR